MRRALIAAVVTSGVLAARRRRPDPATMPVTAPDLPALPQQRTGIAAWVEGDADLSVAEQDAWDDRILALLDRP